MIWIKAHAADLDALPDRIGGLGTSSSGHSLLLGAMRPDDVPYGVLNPPAADGRTARLADLMAAWPLLDPQARHRFAQANQRDFLVDATEAYRAAGGAIGIQWFPDMPHGFAGTPGPETDRALEMMKQLV